ncbi:hypothetical protein [Coraliomargarita parva]|uniref:hypothetical protein n=1 Tax=Coraliomargarita parva TaxID=3014050 RepID=UPI0022B3C6F9|nr:hypothetical protein [Coraliomargarita parva]
MKTRTPSEDHLKVIEKISKRSPELVEENEHFSIYQIREYPNELTTLFTDGLSPHIYTMWRGKESGVELTLTTEKAEAKERAKDLLNALDDSLKAIREKERRPAIEYNGIYAPGYPPHLFFCEELSLTPKMSGQKKVCDRYVRWLAAIPVSDAELRIYDRSPIELISTIKNGRNP